MKFLLQTINKEIKHDFSFTLLESIDFQNWLKNDNNYIQYELTDDKLIPNCIPSCNCK